MRPRTSTLRDHANRSVREFNAYVDFSTYPIRVNNTGPVDLIGYALVGCLLDTDQFNWQADTYVEKPLKFNVKNVIERYVGDVDATIQAFLS